ncbi:MAG: lytic transglycosylase domain-containing protein [Methylovirgula sp.]
MTFRLLIKGDRWRDNLIAIVRVIFLALAFVPAGRAYAASDFCPVIEQEARKNGLPVGFFTRLIWKESRFDPDAISPAGAQGVAQFMPGTASSRGLMNPFKPVEALRESASYLHELLQSFGNLGLAAAAYNAGPGRLAHWLTGQDELPSETVDYVLAVTGHAITEWTTKPIPNLFDEDSCDDLVANLKIKPWSTSPPFESPLENPEWKPWGIQLAGNWHLGLLLASFERIRRHYPSVIGEAKPYIFRYHLPGVRVANFAVRIVTDSRQEANRFCTRLEAVGGACAVLRNPRP